MTDGLMDEQNDGQPKYSIAPPPHTHLFFKTGMTCYSANRDLVNSNTHTKVGLNSNN